MVASYLIGNALLDKPTSASDEEITPQTVLINGRSIEDVASLVARGDILRESSLEADVRDVAFSAIVEDTAIDGNPAFSEELLRFLLRGGSSFPVLSEKDTFLVFYNPILGITLVTSWQKEAGVYKLSHARYVPSEKVLGQSPTLTRPIWRDVTNIPDALTETVMNYSRITSESGPETVKRLLNIMAFAPSEADVKIVRDRFALGIVGISDVISPCGPVLSAKTTTLVTLRQTAAETNMGNFTGDAELIPVGGYSNDQFGFRILAQKKNPSVLVLVAADTKADCKIDGAYVVDTMQSIQED